MGRQKGLGTYDKILEMIVDLHEFYYSHNRPPKQSELKSNSYYCYETYRKYFGTFKKSFFISGLPIIELTREEYLKKYKKEHIEDEKRYSKNYYIQNKTKCLNKSLNWNKENGSKMANASLRWRKKNPLIVKTLNKKARARRNKWGFNPLNEYFGGSHGHHLHINNNSDVMYIPKELHNSIRHSYNNLESMNEINDAAFKWYYSQNIESITGMI